MKKLKIATLIITVLMFNVQADTYKLEIGEKHYKNSVSIEDYTTPNTPEPLTCELPEVLNEEQTACETPPPECTGTDVLNETQDACIDTIEAVGWIYTNGDTCNGMRPADFNPRVYYARSRTTSPSLSRPIPEGYSWLSQAEYMTLFEESTVVNKGSSWRYYGHCGLSGYPNAGGTQYTLLLRGSGGNGFHTGQKEGYNNLRNSTSSFAGYVLYKND